MMKFTDKLFLQKYCVIKTKGKKEIPGITDHFQGQGSDKKLYPFTQNPTTCFFDGGCGIRGVAGEFYRLNASCPVKPIYSNADALQILEPRLRNTYKMSENDKQRFIELFNDVMFDEEALNVVDSSFFSFVPMKFFASTPEMTKKEYPRQGMYRLGQRKMAHYYCSIARKCEATDSNAHHNLFCNVVFDCLRDDKIGGREEPESYYVLPFVQERFANDFKWLMGKSDDIIVRYLPLFLHFYACFSIMQTLVFMNKSNWHINTDKPKVMSYALTSEKVSAMADCVRKGWDAVDNLSDTFITKLSSYSQALDILNCMFEDESEFLSFQDVMKRFAAMSFDEEKKAVCERVLTEYQTRKNNVLESRTTESRFEKKETNTSVSSFDDFVNKLLNLCIRLQSKDYTRLKRSVDGLFKIKLRAQRRNYKVLVLDEELLLLLTAMVVGDEDRIRVDELYRRFKDRYGIDFSYSTKELITEYLQKLNLIDHKSDSGDAQYVRTVL